MEVHGLGRQDERRGGLADRITGHDAPQHVHLAVGQAGRPLAPDPWSRVACRREHRVDRGRFQLPLPRQRPQLRRGLAGVQRPPVSTGVPHRDVGVGGAQHAAEHGLGPAAPVIPRAVAALMVAAGQRGGLGQYRDLRQHPLAVVRVQPNRFPLGVVERAGLIPDRAADPDPAQVVSEGGKPQGPLFRGRQAQPLGGTGGQIGDLGRVTGEKRRLLVREVPHHPSCLDEAVITGDPVRLGLGGQQVRPQRRSCDHRQDAVRIGAEDVHDRGVERAAGALGGHRYRRVPTLESVVHLDIVRQDQDPDHGRDRGSRDPVWRPGPVPALEHLVKPGHDGRRQAEPGGQEAGHLAVTEQIRPSLVWRVTEQLLDHGLPLRCWLVDREGIHDPAAERLGVTEVKMLNIPREGHLVPEHLRVIRRVGGAAQHPHQRQVVQVAKLPGSQATSPSEFNAEQARPHRVLHRQAKPQIRRHPDDSENLGKPKPSPHDPLLVHRRQARRALP